MPNIMTMNGLDSLNMNGLNDMLGGANKGKKNINKCCIERDICRQTCGMSAKECFDAYQKCKQKTCKSDQNCELNAMMADFDNDPFDNPNDRPKEERYESKNPCKGYHKGQQERCRCVPKDNLRSANEEKLASFY